MIIKSNQLSFFFVFIKNKLFLITSKYANTIILVDIDKYLICCLFTYDQFADPY